MFKNYLTYQIVLSFERSCGDAALTRALGEKASQSLQSSVRNVVHHFTRSLHTRDRKDESKLLFVALLCLRDCREILDQAKPEENLRLVIDSQYAVLHARFEQLCEKACASEGGQMRMLG